jgi:hypothetical protein
MELDENVEKEVVENCEDMNGWIKFLGIASIIWSVFFIIGTFGIGIIIAWAPIWIGIILMRAANSAREVGVGNVESLGEMLGSFKTFFLLSGVAVIISVVFSIIWFIVIGIAMVGGFMDSTGGFY